MNVYTDIYTSCEPFLPVCPLHADLPVCHLIEIQGPALFKNSLIIQEDYLKQTFCEIVAKFIRGNPLERNVIVKIVFFQLVFVGVHVLAE